MYNNATSACDDDDDDGDRIYTIRGLRKGAAVMIAREGTGTM